MGGGFIRLCPYPILLPVTQQDCNKVENGYKTLENPIEVTVAILLRIQKSSFCNFTKILKSPKSPTCGRR